MTDQLVLLCRAGFEKECAGEIIERAAQCGIGGHAIAVVDRANLSFHTTPPENLYTLIRQLDFRSLIFCRQWFVSDDTAVALPEKNRLPVILDALPPLLAKLGAKGFAGVEMDYADTNEGRSISRFCNRFQPHLLAAMQSRRLLDETATWRLHCLFSHSREVTLGASPVDNSATDAMGIPRLKMPDGAPSRSTLKLDEAIRFFFTPDEQAALFQPGMTAVDLGAAPGGWSWQLVRRHLHVTAIDNGPMQAGLLDSGLVTHLRTDAFTYQPPTPVDWLLCDMAERPLHVGRLIARWLADRRCRHSLFNLKLPMKKRMHVVRQAIEQITTSLQAAQVTHRIRARQLYHDREEITVCITTDA